MLLYVLEGEPLAFVSYYFSLLDLDIIFHWFSSVSLCLMIVITALYRISIYSSLLIPNCIVCGFDQQRLIWYVCYLWDMVFS